MQSADHWYGRFQGALWTVGVAIVLGVGSLVSKRVARDRKILREKRFEDTSEVVFKKKHDTVQRIIDERYLDRVDALERKVKQLLGEDVT